MPGRDSELHADFHTHTTASDGMIAPASLVNMASERGLSTLAITDHDTVAGLEDASLAAAEVQMRFIPGIEFNTSVARGELHLLGYGIDPRHSELLRELERLRSSRRRRAEVIVEKLNDLGLAVDIEELLDAGSDDSIGRPHIGRKLIELGAVDSVQEAFDRYLGFGRPAYAPRESITPERAIAQVLQAGGIPVLAHPFSLPDFESWLDTLMNSGLLGIEVYYGEYDEDQKEYLASVAERRNLIPTGGSDYHGPDFREGRELGSVAIPHDVIERFLRALEDKGMPENV